MVSEPGVREEHAKDRERWGRMIGCGDTLKKLDKAERKIKRAKGAFYSENLQFPCVVVFVY